MTKSLALEGQRFGRLYVLHREGRYREREITWKCLCDCGNYTIALGWELKGGWKRSCGCLRKERSKQRSTTHGLSQSPEYRIYRAMLTRCYDKNSKSYTQYGARGVTVCDRWNPATGGSFENFIEDMGFRPSPKHQLDKEAVDKSNKVYCPEYCRWVLPKTNQRNRSNIMIVTYKGEQVFAIDLALRLGINNATLQNRIKRGWPESRWAEPVNR